MAKYVVRVELHGATEGNYTTLHAAMEQRGFARKVAAANGIVYKMPTAEYYVDTTYDLDRVRSAALEAANTTGCKSGVLVTEANVIGWIGLPAA